MAAGITTPAHWLWVLVLDADRALEALTYDGHESLVPEIAGVDGLTGGRYRGPGGLAALWLGDESAVRLAALGRVREERAGAARKADALLRTSGRPWCPDMF